MVKFRFLFLPVLLGLAVIAAFAGCQKTWSDLEVARQEGYPREYAPPAPTRGWLMVKELGQQPRGTTLRFAVKKVCDSIPAADFNRFVPQGAPNPCDENTVYRWVTATIGCNDKEGQWTAATMISAVEKFTICSKEISPGHSRWMDTDKFY
jgi:hypothetical protein